MVAATKSFRAFYIRSHSLQSVIRHVLFNLDHKLATTFWGAPLVLTASVRTTVLAQEQRTSGALDSPVLADGLADRKNVRLIERAVQ